MPAENIAVHLHARAGRADEGALNATLEALVRGGIEISRQVNLTRGHFLSTQLVSRRAR